MHGQQHWAEFYTDYGVRLQKRFFGHFLKGEDTGWDTQPPVHLNVRRVDGTFEGRNEREWPLARTQWTRWDLGVAAPAAFEADGDGLTVLGRDFTFDGPGPWPHSYGVDMRGNGIFVHTDERARPRPLFGGTTTLYGGSVLLPVVGPKG